MRKTYILFLLGSLFSVSVNAQNAKLLDGRIRTLDNNVVGVAIENLANKEKTGADTAGYFMIDTKVGDTIRFQSKGYVTVNYIIGQEDLDQNRLNIVLARKNQNLEEIIITRKDMGNDYFDLGLKKEMSPAEKMFSANNTLTSATETGGLGISIDAFVNLLSGKRKKDKAAVKYERLEKSVGEFEALYPKEDLVTDLSIPTERVDGFLYYLVVQPDYDLGKVARTPLYQMILAKQYSEFLIFIGSN